MIVVTGGAGFIGSNVARALLRRGTGPIVIVDDLTDGSKVANVADLDVWDYLDRDEFRDRVRSGTALGGVTAVIHQGATSSTTEPDGRMVMDNNYTTSRELIDACAAARVPLVYASSAAVYGASPAHAEDPANERPLNVYGWSKLMTDRYARRTIDTTGAAIAGLRYFNVYGPGEDHKGAGASVAAQLDDALTAGRPAAIFGAGAGVGPGEHRRDFVAVDDVVATILWFLEHPDATGIYNCGTGVAATFREIADLVAAFHPGAEVGYVDFPAELEARYQAATRADLTRLRRTGCDVTFRPVSTGVPEYLLARRHPHGTPR